MKFLVITIAFSLALIFNASAQITTSWTFALPDTQIPTGGVIPTISKLTSPRSENFTLDLDGDTHDNAVAVAGFAAIGAATKVAIDSNYIEDVWGLNPTANIVGRIYITNIERRFDNYAPLDLKNQYLEATNIFRVTGRFEWVVNP